MADKKLADLTAASELTSNDLFYAVQGGEDKKVTNELLMEYIKTTGLETFIHDLKFASSFNYQAELPIYVNVGGEGQKKIYFSQLLAYIQNKTSIDDLVLSLDPLQNGDIVAYNTTGGTSGQGGWEVVHGLIRLETYGANFTVPANGSKGIMANDISLSPIQGYRPLGVMSYSALCEGSTVYVTELNPFIDLTQNQRFGRLRNIDSSDAIVEFGVVIAWVKEQFATSS